MTREELIAKGKHKVRGNSDLMRIYITLFAERFGHAPNCAGCTFDSDWRKFVSLDSKNGTLTTQNVMDKTFKLKRNIGEIISYKKDGKTYRAYANKATEQFMMDYLTYGTPEQIEDRRKLFAVLPTLNTEPVKEAKPKRQTKKK